MDSRVSPEWTSGEFDPSWDRVKRIGRGPLSMLRRSLWWFRKTFFTRPRSSTDALRVSQTRRQLRALFGRHYFEPGWETSYQYRNEILNLRRAVYDAEHDGGIEWWQVHIRGYPVPETHGKGASVVDLTAHFEPEPVEHPDAHVGKGFIDIDRGLAAMRAVLDEEGIEYEVIEAPA